MLQDSQIDAKSVMQSVLDQQKRAHQTEGTADYSTRLGRIDRAIALLEKYGERLCDAMARDFGHRSIHQSRMTDIEFSRISLRDAKQHLRKWMRPENRKPLFPLGFLGARARIEYQPLGVVGCISPWNFPIQLTFSPLAGIFAAGNRVMIKPSEFTPVTSELLKEAFAQFFDSREAAVFTGGAEVGSAFSSLPFDHLVFTGSSLVAKHVMRAAAENLVPLTLELGGKSPVIIGKNADIAAAAARIMAGKTTNAGQICLAPDYVFIPEGSIDKFIDYARDSVAKMFPTLRENPDYTSIINEKNYNRILNYIEDARLKGAHIVEMNPAREDFTTQSHFRLPPTIIVNPTDDMDVMQEEIFGPVLLIKKYNDLTEVSNYINNRPRPLALYYFGNDRNEERFILNNTTSGGVTINDVMMHAVQEDLPFGGVGPSGMGSYHGHHGFKTFSNARSIFTQSRLVAKFAATMWPPYR